MPLNKETKPQQLFFAISTVVSCKQFNYIVQLLPNFGSRFFTRTPSIIRQIVKEVVDRFLRKSFLFILKLFFQISVGYYWEVEQ